MGESVNRLLFLSTVLVALVSCASNPKSEVSSEDAVNDALISFTVNSQAGRYSEALELIAYEDQLKIIDANGNWKPEYKSAVKRIRLSALQKIHFSLDTEGRLEGMIAILDDANSKFTMSDEQRSVNLDKVEKNRKATSPSDSTKRAEEPAVVTEPVVEEPQPAMEPEADSTDSVAEPVPATPENLDVEELFQ